MNSPKIIAEIGCNHMGNFETAKKLIETAATFCNADYAKFQKRNNEDETHFFCPNSLVVSCWNYCHNDGLLRLYFNNQNLLITTFHFRPYFGGMMEKWKMFPRITSNICYGWVFVYYSLKQWRFKNKPFRNLFVFQTMTLRIKPKFITEKWKETLKWKHLPLYS